MPNKTNNKPELILTIDKQVKLILQTSKAVIMVNLDDLVVNFPGALDVPGEKYRLSDYCGVAFFTNKGLDEPLKLFEATKVGDLDGAEAFVEYGAYLGMLIANLEKLFNPKKIMIKGRLSKTFAAWEHAMGKMRKQVWGKKPGCKIEVIK